MMLLIGHRVTGIHLHAALLSAASVWGTREKVLVKVLDGACQRIDGRTKSRLKVCLFLLLSQQTLLQTTTTTTTIIHNKQFLSQPHNFHPPLVVGVAVAMLLRFERSLCCSAESKAPSETFHSDLH